MPIWYPVHYDYGKIFVTSPMELQADLPDFLLVGAAKSGTSSLYSYLVQHPEVFLPAVKEPNYFAYRGMPLDTGGPKAADMLEKLLHKKTVTRLDEYKALYSPAKTGQTSGDCSPRYLYYPNAPEAIHELIPEARIVMILRNPIDRAYSHYLMNRQRDLEPEDLFLQAAHLENERIEQGWGWDWHYLQVGMYGQQLQRYYKRFPAENILIILHDELVADVQGVVRKIFQFIGVDEDFLPDTGRRYKVASTQGAADSYLGRLVFATESTWLGALAIRLIPKKFGLWMQNHLRDRLSRKGGGTEIPPLDTDTRMFCWELLKEDVQVLEKLLDKDLSGWNPEE